jgi:hypothetical protein
MDAIFDGLEYLYTSTVGFVLLMTVAVSVPALLLIRWRARRAAFAEFAARHDLRFVGVHPGDKRLPFAAFERVRLTALLYHVMEGRWQGLDVVVFDAPNRRQPTSTCVIVSLPRDLTPFRVVPSTGFRESHRALAERFGGWSRVTPRHPFLATGALVTAEHPEATSAALGPRASDLLASALRASDAGLCVEAHFGYLLVSRTTQLPPGELTAFLGFSTSLASALVADAGPA